MACDALVTPHEQVQSAVASQSGIPGAGHRQDRLASGVQDLCRGATDHGVINVCAGGATDLSASSQGEQLTKLAERVAETEHADMGKMSGTDVMTILDAICETDANGDEARPQHNTNPTLNPAQPSSHVQAKAIIDLFGNPSCQAMLWGDFQAMPHNFLPNDVCSACEHSEKIAWKIECSKRSLFESSHKLLII